jgi:hypothetical protein
MRQVADSSGMAEKLVSKRKLGGIRQAVYCTPKNCRQAEGRMAGRKPMAADGPNEREI